jgi:Mg2+-importing ATPase
MSSGTARMFRADWQEKIWQVSERLKLRPANGIRTWRAALRIPAAGSHAVARDWHFAFNVHLARPVLDSLLFAPERRSADPAAAPRDHQRESRPAPNAWPNRTSSSSASPSNFGSMSVLCSDKTGTLTEGKVVLESATDTSGHESQKVLAYAALNAFFQTGYTNPMDPAILARHAVVRAAWRKLDEEPYDFTRRRMSVLVANADRRIMVTKGALPNVLEVCSRAEASDGTTVDVATVRVATEKRLHALSQRGLRVLGVAYRLIPSETGITKEHESDMIFLGILSFSDPLRPDIVQTVRDLRAAGITLKIITGDHHLVALDVSRQAGFVRPRWLTGPDLRKTSDAALLRRVNDIDVFAEVEPNQKERLILALRKSGQVVGYMGDGISDASALHAADVRSRSQARRMSPRKPPISCCWKRSRCAGAQRARRARHVCEHLKYVFMATSANFGNMLAWRARRSSSPSCRCSRNKSCWLIC